MAINIRPNLDLFFNARNLFDEPIQTFIEGDVWPTYARDNGSTVVGSVFNVGIRGSF